MPYTCVMLLPEHTYRPSKRSWAAPSVGRHRFRSISEAEKAFHDGMPLVQVPKPNARTSATGRQVRLQLFTVSCLSKTLNTHSSCAHSLAERKRCTPSDVEKAMREGAPLLRLLDAEERAKPKDAASGSLSWPSPDCAAAVGGAALASSVRSSTSWSNPRNTLDGGGGTCAEGAVREPHDSRNAGTQVHEE